METVAILKQARKLIQQGWCQEAYARDANGNKVEAVDETAVCWCISGAILKAAGGYQGRHGEDAERVVDYFAVVIGTIDVSGWNDSPATTKEKVLKAIDDLLDLKPWSHK